MISIDNIKYSLRNLWIRKSRSFLTILSIFIGIATIFIFISFGLGLFTYVDELVTSGAADKFMVQGRGGFGASIVSLDKDDLRVIERTRGVIEATPMYFRAGEVSYRGQKRFVFVNGIDPRSELFNELMTVTIYQGRMLSPGDLNNVVLGYNYLEDNRIFGRAVQLNDRIEIDGDRYRVIGFYEKLGNLQDDSNIYMTLEGYEQKYPDTTYYAMIIGRSPVEDMGSTIDRTAKNLREHRGETEENETLSIQSFLNQIEVFQTILNLIIGFIVLIALISVFVSAINTANTMVTSVLERIREIGIIKSIGAKNSEIFNIFLFESSFLGFVAGIIGIIIGFIMTEILGNLLDFYGWGFLQPYYSITLFISCVLFATIIGAISGVAPAYSAAKRKPVDSLRYE